jgi:hypothetical protein
VLTKPLKVVDFFTLVSMKLGTGYDYPDLPGLGNNNEKLELPETLSTVYTNKYRQIKFRMKIYNKIGTYKNKSTTTINNI